MTRPFLFLVTDFDWCAVRLRVSEAGCVADVVGSILFEA